jgi:photosystem II stability/assembly factor-like uncharacterized protein
MRCHASWNAALRLATFLCLSFCGLVARGEHIQLFAWKNVNIQGMGWVTGLVIQPRPPYDIYIRTDVGGSYRFDRSESKWIPLMDSLETQAGVGTESIAIDQNNLSRVYAVINRPRSVIGGRFQYAAEVMLSEDRGTHWRGTGFVEKGVYEGANDDYRVETGERLAVDPADSSILYFASRRNGLWKGVRRSDGAYEWTSVNGGPPAWTNDPAGDTFVLFAPATARDGVPETIYVGVHSSGVWRSTDGGRTWEDIGGAENPGRGAVASDGTLYVSFGTTKPASGSVRRFRDGIWTDITPGNKTAPYTGVSVDPANPAIVMVGRDNIVWRSTSAGNSWTSQHMIMHRHDPFAPGSNPSAPAYYLSNTDGASGGVSTVMIDPENSHHAWWINGWGVARTDDVTAEQPFWAWEMNNLEELCAVMVRVPPKPKAEGGADLITMAMDMIGFRIENRDKVPESKISPSGVPLDPRPDFAWQAKLFGPTAYPVPWPYTSMGSSLDYSVQHPDIMAFVGHLQWLYWPVYGLSHDGGKSWTAFQSIPKEKLWDDDEKRVAIPIGGQIAMSSANPLNFVWAPTWGTFDGIQGSPAFAPWPHVTFDGGKTWLLCRLTRPHTVPGKMDVHDNEKAHSNALPRSSQNATQPWVSTRVLASDRADPAGKLFYYLAGSVFFTSRDGGLTWDDNSNTGFPSDRVDVTVLSNPAKTGDVWVAFGRGDHVQGTQLFHSSDAGKSFSAVKGVEFCDKIAFGRGNDAKLAYLYMLGRLDGQTTDAIFKSEDLGSSWIRITEPNETPMMDVVQMEGDMRTRDLLYLALDGRGVMYGVPSK